jgi:kynurenine formamidase
VLLGVVEGCWIVAERLADKHKLGHENTDTDRGIETTMTFPKPKGGSGFPARVFAILP